MMNTKFRSFPVPAFAGTNLFDDMISRDLIRNRNEFRKFNPAVNVKESTDQFQIEMAVPGMEKSDFNIAVENDLLTISSEKKAEETQTTEKYTRKEFYYGTFTRSFSLPESVNAEAITAAYENGILKVVLPKKTEASAPKTKQIQIG